ncbi:MAG: DUF1266 domain-containing protein [Clostridium sp.]|nr:DUF1266 domain-containing protein [Clostridium sp.]
MEKKRRTMTKATITAAALILLFLLGGCGKKPVVLKTYTAPDETYSIEADEKYTNEDVGMDNWLALESTEEIEDTLAVMQFPKTGGFWGSFTSIEDVIVFVEETTELTTSDKQNADKPENGELSNVQAYTYEGTEDGYKYKITAAYAETDYAYYAFVMEEAVVKRHSSDYFGTVCASFKENAEVIEEKTSFAVDVTDTIRWFNASNAILIAANGWDYQLYGGLQADDMNKEVARQLLDESWDVTDKDSADETLDWLLSEGHRTDFTSEMEILDEMEFYTVAEEERKDALVDNLGLDEVTAEYYAAWYGRYEEDYEDAASGWDYNRALSQLANFYLAGYYTLEESLDASLKVAQTIQSSFDSWDDYMESYFTGYEYWAQESSDERRAVYESLKSASDNPYSVDFKTSLEKSW